MSETIGVYDRIENVKNIMENLEDWEDVEISFSHKEAFEVYAYVRAKNATDMEELHTIHKILTEHGFEETTHEIGGSNEWSYQWHHSNY